MLSTQNHPRFNSTSGDPADCLLTVLRLAGDRIDSHTASEIDVFERGVDSTELPNDICDTRRSVGETDRADVRSDSVGAVDTV